MSFRSIWAEWYSMIGCLSTLPDSSSRMTCGEYRAPAATRTAPVGHGCARTIRTTSRSAADHIWQHELGSADFLSSLDVVAS